MDFLQEASERLGIVESLQKALDPQHNLSLRTQYQLIGINHITHYHKPHQDKESDLTLSVHRDKEYMKYPEKGVLRMRDYLVGLGYTVGLKRTCRLLLTMGLEAIYRKPNLSRLDKAKYISNRIFSKG